MTYMSNLINFDDMPDFVEDIENIIKEKGYNVPTEDENIDFECRADYKKAIKLKYMPYFTLVMEDILDDHNCLPDFKNIQENIIKSYNDYLSSLFKSFKNILKDSDIKCEYKVKSRESYFNMIICGKDNECIEEITFYDKKDYKRTLEIKENIK